MKAVIAEGKGSFEVVSVKDIEKPQPTQDEILVKILAAGVNPVDWKTVLNGYFSLPTILGSDIAGVVEATGPAVTAFRPGDRVIGSLEWQKQGAFAEYVSTKEDYLQFAPASIPLADAAAIPLASLTAWQALFDHGQLKAGEKVVVQAGAGGVGYFAIQFAKWKGAHVITTASEGNRAFLLAAGADEVIDYHQFKLSEKVKDADLVLDSQATPDIQLESFRSLKKGGRYISITAGPREELLKGFDITAKRFLFISNPQQLGEIVNLIDQGIVKLHIDQRFPMEKAAEALQYVHKGHTRGKVILYNEGV